MIRGDHKNRNDRNGEPTLLLAIEVYIRHGGTQKTKAIFYRTLAFHSLSLCAPLGLENITPPFPNQQTYFPYKKSKSLKINFSANNITLISATLMKVTVLADSCQS